MMKKMMGKTSANNSNDSENTSIDTTMDNSGGHIGPMTTVSGAQKFTQGMMGDRKFRTRDGLGSGATAFGHTGQDIGMNHGTPLSLGQSGTVIDIGIMGDSNDPGGSGGDNGGYGNFVAIQTSDGGVIKANHLSQVSVRKGQTIQPGQVFGKVGSTGLSTGPHLHIDRGSGYIPGPAKVTGLVDPVPWVLAGGILRGGTSNGIAPTASNTTQPSQFSAPTNNNQVSLQNLNNSTATQQQTPNSSIVFVPGAQTSVAPLAGDPGLRPVTFSSGLTARQLGLWSLF